MRSRGWIILGLDIWRARRAGLRALTNRCTTSKQATLKAGTCTVTSGTTRCDLRTLLAGTAKTQRTRTHVSPRPLTPVGSGRAFTATGRFLGQTGTEATANTLIDTSNTIDSMRQKVFGGVPIQAAKIEPTTSAGQYGHYAGMIVPFLIPCFGEADSLKILTEVGSVVDDNAKCHQP